MKTQTMRERLRSMGQTDAAPTMDVYPCQKCENSMMGVPLKDKLCAICRGSDSG